MAADAKFCPQCGRPLAETARPSISGNSWARRTDDFATKVEVDDVEGSLSRNLIIEPGTRAILLGDGRNIGVVGPGRHTMTSFLAKFNLLRSPKRMTAILVDAGDVDLEFQVGDLFTRDPLCISLDCRVVAQIEQPVLFLTNLMKGQRSFTLNQLRQYLFDEIRGAAAAFISERSVDELNTNLSLKRELAQDIEMHLNRTFERNGLAFVQVRTMNYRHEHYDEVRDTRADYFLQISKEEAELGGRQRLFDVLNEKEIQEIAEETAKVANFEQRAQVWDRMRRAVLSDRMNEVRTEEEMEEFLQQIDRQKLVRTNEWEELKQEFSERKADHDLARAHLLARTALERDYGRRQSELALRTDLSRQELEAELGLERQRMEGRQAIEARRYRWEIDRDREQAAFQREEQALNDAAEREQQLQAAIQANEIALAQAKTQAEIAALEREQDRLDGELGIALLAKMKAEKRRDEAERMRMAMERRGQELELDLKRSEAELERQLRLEREKRAFEIERLQTLATMSTEALIAASEGEQAGLLAELRKTETLKEMTADQILAMAAERSPEIARAFQERFRAMPPELQNQLEEMYEARLADRDASTERLTQLQRENAQRLQEMFDRALEEQRRTAEALARGRGEGGGPTVILGPSGQPTVVGGGVAGTSASLVGPRVAVCRSCGAESPVGTKFCANCGEAFF